jgi:hypothetical protein
MAQSGRLVSNLATDLARQLAPDGDRFNVDLAASVQVAPRPAFESGEQSRRQFVNHARAIVLSQLLAKSFFRLTPIKPFA